MSKELCDCGNIAVWCYMPGFSSGSNPHFCDECVNRGCECNHNHLKEEYKNNPEGVENVNWKWIEKDVSWTPIDEKGREYPCVEYMWEPEGWEKELNSHEL